MDNSREFTGRLRDLLCREHGAMRISRRVVSSAVGSSSLGASSWAPDEHQMAWNTWYSATRPMYRSLRSSRASLKISDAMVRLPYTGYSADNLCHQCHNTPTHTVDTVDGSKSCLNACHMFQMGATYYVAKTALLYSDSRVMNMQTQGWTGGNPVGCVYCHYDRVTTPMSGVVYDFTAGATPGTPPSSTPRPPWAFISECAPTCGARQPATSDMGYSSGSDPEGSCTVS